ncbi:MAG: thioredoxin family protein, partial [Erysipelotrichaceae bacterium]|nr:thioredoxin family protein [Erysipelotrichaceae bacterium]
ALYVYLPGCASCASFYPIVKEFSDTQQIDIYAVDLTVLFHDENSVSKRITYTPSMFIYQDGEVLAYLDPQSDEDLPIYHSLEALTTWFSECVDMEVFRSDSISEISDCENACSLSE